MTIWYCQNSASNINAAANWDDNPAGGGNDLTWANLAAGDILCANGKTAIAINVDFTCATIQTSGSANGASGTDGGGFTVDLSSGTGRNTAITCSLVAGTTPCVVESGTTRSMNITGSVTGGGSAGAYGLTATISTTISGNVTAGGNATAYGVYSSTGGVGATIGGNVLAATAPALAGNAATWTITGNLTAVDGVPAVTVQTASNVTVVLSGNLVCSANGTFPIRDRNPIYLKLAGTASGKTFSARDGSLTEVVLKVPDYPSVHVVAETAAAFDYGALQGDRVDPDHADVRYGVEYANPAAYTTGALEIPNTDSPTGTQDETSDACVVSGKKYGHPQRTGTAAGGTTYFVI